MMSKRIYLALMATTVSLIVYLFDISLGAASSFQKEVDHNKIGFSASRYRQASGSRPPHEDAVESGTRYMVKPWNANCTSTTLDQVCTATSLPKCREKHPDDKNNRWRAFDIFISQDGGDTYPTYPNAPDIPKVCLNTVALDAPERAPLDPRLVFQEATKLVPKGKWHPQPNGQAVVNKPVIVTVETNRNQTFTPFTLLGYHVEVKAHINSYEWHYGDGSATESVNWPGQEFNSTIGDCTAADCTSYVNHNYTHTGKYNIQLTLHWNASYKVDNGNWQLIPGTITTTSPPQNIAILNAHSQLVAGN